MITRRGLFKQLGGVAAIAAVAPKTLLEPVSNWVAPVQEINIVATLPSSYLTLLREYLEFYAERFGAIPAIGSADYSLCEIMARNVYDTQHTIVELYDNWSKS